MSTASRLSEGHALVARSMTEAQLQSAVLNLAGDLGYLCYHTHDSRRSQAGHPDLTLIRGGVLIFAELKTEKSRMRPDQTTWLTALGKLAGVTTGAVRAYVWRPSDLILGDIARALTGGT